MSTTRPELINLQPIDEAESEFFCVPGEEWGQGFATYGGYVAASCYKAAKQCGHERPLLSAQVNYLAPSPTTGYRIEVEGLRVGKGTSIVEVRTWAPNRKDPDGPEILAAKILFTYGEPRATAIHVSSQIDQATMARLTATRQQRAAFPVLKNIIPTFLDQFHFISVEGAVPYSNSNALGHAFAVSRKQEWRVTDPMEFLVLMSDINPPPQLQLLAMPASASTMTWMLDIAAPLPDSFNDGAWMHVILQLERASNGYGAHSGILMDEDGQVLSSTRQVTAVFETDVGGNSPKHILNRFAFSVGFNLFRAFNGLRQVLHKRSSR